MKNKLLFGLAFFMLNSTMNAQSGLEAKGFAYDAARQMMNTISPLTGHGPKVKIIDAQYSKRQDRYILEMKAFWYGSPCLICDEATFMIHGILKVNQDGSNPVFQEMESNDAVESARTFNNMATVGTMIMLDAMNENNKNFNTDDNAPGIPDLKLQFLIQNAVQEFTVYEKPDTGSLTKGTIAKGQKYSYLETQKPGWRFVYIKERLSGFIETSIE